MSKQIKVSYEAVYSKTSQLSTSVRNRIAAMEQQYSRIITSIDSMDGASNAALKEAIERNKRKAAATAGVLLKLLSFIEGSTKQVENHEGRMAARFSQGGRAVR